MKNKDVENMKEIFYKCCTLKPYWSEFEDDHENRNLMIKKHIQKKQIENTMLLIQIT